MNFAGSGTPAQRSVRVRPSALMLCDALLQSVPMQHKTILVAYIKSGWKHGWSFHGVHGSVESSSEAHIQSLTAPELVQQGTLLWSKSKWRIAFSLTRKTKDAWLDLARKRSLEAHDTQREPNPPADSTP